MYWDIQQPLKYNALFNFIVGARGVGKTYGCKEFCIDNYFADGSQFVYVRRYKDELSGIKNFFDDISEKYEQEFKVHNRTFLTEDNEPIGFYLPLSTAKVNKSVPFPKVTDIIFDEFIIDKGFTRYIPDEVTNFLELYSTIARGRDVRVWFLSNAITTYNPYFLYFNIKLPYKKDGIRVEDDILVQMVQDNEFAEKMSQTRFGRLISGTPYGDYNMNNKFLVDTRTFIAKKTGNAKYFFSFIWDGETYGVWLDGKAGAMYVSTDNDTTCKIVYTFMEKDQQPNTVLLKGIRPYCIKTFVDVYKMGGLYYESQNIKNICTEILRLCL